MPPAEATAPIMTIVTTCQTRASRAEAARACCSSGSADRPALHGSEQPCLALPRLAGLESLQGWDDFSDHGPASRAEAARCSSLRAYALYGTPHNRHAYTT